MPGFVLNPISDPDDIRREAAANTPNSPIAAQQARIDEIQADASKTDQSESVTAGQAQTFPDNNDPIAPTSMTADTQGVPLETPTTPLQNNELPQAGQQAAGAAEQPAQQTAEQAPVLAITSSNAGGTPSTNMVAPKSFTPSSVYPNPTHEVKVADKLEGQATYSYSYKLPVGVYIIASFALEIALVLWVLVLFFGATHWLFFLNATLFTACGASLLLGYSIARWASVVAGGIGALYYGYQLIKAMVDYADNLRAVEYLLGGYSSYIKGGFFLFAVGVLYLLVSTYYLSRSDVGRSFR